MLKKLFGFDSKVTTVRTELFAGLTTFLTMSYVLAVNPEILSAAGMDRGAVFTATALAAAIATYIVAFYAKMPLAQAPGMGLNAFFAYTLVVMLGYSWQTALTVTLIEGLIFIVLTLLNIRDKIINAIPYTIRLATTVGIGFFIAFIGLSSSGIIVNNDATLVSLCEFNTSTTIAAIGILVSGVLVYKKVSGALFYSIIGCTLLSFVCGVIALPESFSPISIPSSFSLTFMKFDFSEIFTLDMLIIIFMLAFVDMFNTIGALVGAAYQADIIDKDGNIPKMKECLLADAFGTTIGAMLGTSTVTTYSESSAGIAEGGRSGLTAFTIATLFMLSLLFTPIFTLIPSIATVGPLVVVGTLMISCAKGLNYEDMSEAMPAFITIIMMVLTYSIAEGMALGILSYTLIKIATGQFRSLNWALVAVSFLIVLKYL
ncbi:MAG: NCS2 family permease [Rikenellaceae bacterium]